MLDAGKVIGDEAAVVSAHIRKLRGHLWLNTRQSVSSLRGLLSPVEGVQTRTLLPTFPDEWYDTPEHMGNEHSARLVELWDEERSLE